MKPSKRPRHSIAIVGLVLASIANTAYATLIQNTELSRDEFAGVARALNQETWTEHYLNRYQTRNQVNPGIVAALADAQKEWLEHSKSSSTSNQWPMHLKLWRQANELDADGHQRTLIAKMFDRLTGGQTHLAPDQQNQWRLRSRTLNPLREKSSDPTDMGQMKDATADLRRWLLTWDAILIDGMAYRQSSLPQGVRLTPTEHRLIFVSNSLRTVAVTISVEQFQSYAPPQVPLLSGRCRSGQLVQLDPSLFESDPVLREAYENRTLRAVGSGLCQMSISPVRSDRIGTASEKDETDIRAFGLERGTDGIYMPSNEPDSIKSRSNLWIGVAVGILAAGAYAFWRQQQQQDPAPAVHHQGF
ncbi:MAG: hypothetical protein IPJ84_05275 [Bdellovibrionales bacterium]|nr:hypothetical protein [Bdellovibrionales bacterium]